MSGFVREQCAISCRGEVAFVALENANFRVDLQQVLLEEIYFGEVFRALETSNLRALLHQRRFSERMRLNVVGNEAKA
jgi:hypothetical protein